MAVQYTNKTQLANYLKGLVAYSLQEEDMQKAIKETMQEHLETDVYAQYTPYVYQRRKEDGGLLDADNIEIKPINNSGLDTTISVKEVAGYNGQPDNQIYDTLAERIEYGLPRGRVPYKRPRPFMQETYEDLKQSGLITKTLKKNMQKHISKIIEK